jgi:hypothetical protein
MQSRVTSVLGWMGGSSVWPHALIGSIGIREAGFSPRGRRRVNRRGVIVVGFETACEVASAERARW